MEVLMRVLCQRTHCLPDSWAASYNGQDRLDVSACSGKDGETFSSNVSLPSFVLLEGIVGRSDGFGHRDWDADIPQRYRFV